MDFPNSVTSSAVRLKARLEKVERAMAKVRIRLYPARQVNQRIAQVTDLATSGGLKIDDVQLGRNSKAEHSTRVPICLAGSGTYLTCSQFLRELNRTLPDTGVTLLEMWGNPGSDIEAATFRLDLVWHAAPAGTEPEK